MGRQTLEQTVHLSDAAPKHGSGAQGGGDVTALLQAWRDGDPSAFDEAAPIVYAELHRLARIHLARERDPSLQPTALVHEAYLRLVEQRPGEWQNRAHFFAIAAQMMRRVLVDHARRRLADRRGGGTIHVALDDVGEIAIARSRELLALDAALNELATLDARKCRVVELRFFAGLSVDETAQTLRTSAATVMRDWSTARAWLHDAVAAALGRALD